MASSQCCLLSASYPSAIKYLNLLVEFFMNRMYEIQLMETTGTYHKNLCYLRDRIYGLRKLKCLGIV